MSGRGRGRGRGIPIAYPDGWACKTASASELAAWTPPQPFVMTPADREMLELRKRLLKPADCREFRIADTKKATDFVRYSDRYDDAPVEPFHKSKLMTVKPNVHFAPELLPPTKGAKRARTSSGAAASSSSSSAPQPKRQLNRLKRASGAGFGEALDDDIEDVGEEDDDDDGAAVAKRPGGEEEAAVLTEEEDEDDDLLFDEDGGYNDAYEDGGDDLDDGDDDDGPTY